MNIFKASIYITILIFLDQISKFFVFDNLRVGDSIDVLSFLSISHIHNYGAAFSILADQDGWQRYFLSGFSLIAVGFLFGWLVKLINLGSKFETWGILILISGASGNLIDRGIHGYVIDFINIHFASFQFPVFNIADILICIGLVILISNEFLKK